MVRHTASRRAHVALTRQLSGWARDDSTRSCGYPVQVTPEEVGRYAESLPQVKRKGTESRPAWYVNDRLVVRLYDPNTLVIRVPVRRRESLLDSFPDSFGVPPRMEAHHKVEAYLDQAQPRAMHAAIDLAWEMQRG